MRYFSTGSGRRLIFGAALFVLAATLTGQGTADVRRLTILHTNDEHGQVLPLDAVWRDEAHPPKEGGAVALAAAVARLRAKDPEAMLFSAGDWFQGTPEGTLTDGRVMIALFNALGYDAAAVGNHEFDFGESVVRRLARTARFPIVGANVVGPDRETLRDWINPFVILERRGVKVGVAGLCTEETEKIVIRERLGDVHFADAQQTMRRTLERMKAAGAEVTVFLNHMGPAENTKLAEAVPGADLMIGGHIHSAVLWEGKRVGRTLIAQSGSSLRSLGVVTLDYDRNAHAVTAAEAYVEELRRPESASAPEIDRIVAGECGEILQSMATRVGTLELARPLRKDMVRDHSTSLGNWMADAMRTFTGADLGVMNEGGIRKDVPAGTLTVRDFWEIMPFDNTVCVLTLTGGAIEDLVRTSITTASSGIEISGFTIRAGPKAENAPREITIMIGGRPLDRERIYSLATNSFLADGGDGYPKLREARSNADTHRLLRDVLMRDVINRRALQTTPEARWITTGQKKDEADGHE